MRMHVWEISKARAARAPGAGEVAGAASDESHGQSTPQDSQRALLPEAVHQGRHPPLVPQSAAQLPAQATQSLHFDHNQCISP